MKENTIQKVLNNQCTGCGACYNICPVNAISMIENSEGFLSPSVDETLCINCGKCLHVCSAIDYRTPNEDIKPECIASWTTDELRMQSSSGGLFSVLSSYIIELGGYVCGAKWNENWEVEHSLCNTEKDLIALRGSKYVQSDTKKVYTAIKNLLNNDKPVLFTGTPCQVAGLQKFLGNDNPHLFTVDIVCHGAPSRKAWRKFLLTTSRQMHSNKHIIKKSILNWKQCVDSITNISFRDKNHFGWNIGIAIDYKDGSSYIKQRNETSWYSSFLNILNTREVCGQCKFAKVPRVGDITLGDFWGIKDYDKTLVDGKGTSLVLLNNKKAENLLSQIQHKNKSLFFNPVPIEVCKKKNWNVFGSSKSHKERARFFELLNQYSDYKKITDYSLYRHFDIGYVGWWYGKNYGSALTNFALHQYLVSKNYSVLMLEWPEQSTNFSPISDNMTRRFAKKYYTVSKRRTYNQLYEINQFCDTFIVGSDQLWNYWSTSKNGAYFFLDFVQDTKKKIAYATSFGHNTYGAPKHILRETAFHMQRLDAISVREKEGTYICKDVFGLKAVRNIDPVFLCNKEEYYNAIQNHLVNLEEKYIFAYILSPTKEKSQLIKKISKKLNKKIILVLDAQSHFEQNSEIMNMPDCIKHDIEIEDWLYYIANADYVISDSYHALCFSLIFERQFICFGNIKRGLSRFTTLLKLVGLSKRMFFSPLDSKIESTLVKKINYKTVNLKLQRDIIRSKRWLDKALKAKKNCVSSVYDIMQGQLRDKEKEVSNLKLEIETIKKTITTE